MVASISVGAKACKVFQFSSEFQSEAIIQFSIHNEISWEKNERNHENRSAVRKVREKWVDKVVELDHQSTII